MARRRKRTTAPQALFGLILVLVVVIASFSGLSHLLAVSPVLAGVGLVLAVIGALALLVWFAGRQRLRATTLAQLLALSPSGFEQAVADLLRELGYKDVRRTGGAGDLNVDVWCHDPHGARVAVQCKRYAPSHRVGSPEVQTFIGMIFQHHGADRGWFVTTSSFTEHALRLANQHQIVPVDGAALVKLILDARARREAQRARTPRLLRAPVVALALPLGLVLLGGAAVSEAPAPATRPLASLSVATPAVAPSAVAAASPAAPTSPTPTAPAVTQLRVGNTGGQGVYLRRTPVMSDRMQAYPDGTELQLIGPDVDAGGVHWRHVAAPDGAQGYVPADYVVEAG
jgi:restriction system protein